MTIDATKHEIRSDVAMNGKLDIAGILLGQTLTRIGDELSIQYLLTLTWIQD